MGTFRTNYKVFADWWDVKHTTRLDEAIKEAEEWTRMGYDTVVYEVLTGQIFRKERNNKWA